MDQNMGKFPCGCRSCSCHVSIRIAWETRCQEPISHPYLETPSRKPIIAQGEIRPAIKHKNYSLTNSSPPPKIHSHFYAPFTSFPSIPLHIHRMSTQTHTHTKQNPLPSSVPQERHISFQFQGGGEGYVRTRTKFMCLKAEKGKDAPLPQPAQPLNARPLVTDIHRCVFLGRRRRWNRMHVPEGTEDVCSVLTIGDGFLKIWGGEMREMEEGKENLRGSTKELDLQLENLLFPPQAPSPSNPAQEEKPQTTE